MKDIKELLVTLNIPYKNFSLYIEAFTHSSFHQLQKKTKDYERLEYLGDSIVNFVVAKSLFTTHPEMAQGPLTVARSMLVKTKSLANHARLLHFDEYIKVGPTIDR